MTSAVVLATRNVGKLRELAPLFRAAGVAIVDLAGAGLSEDTSAEDALEVHDSFEANALAKARYFATRLGRPCVADDSGLEVIALGGAPGVRSRRWARDEGTGRAAGQSEDGANNDLLLHRLSTYADRRARFVCAAAYAGGGHEFVFIGTVDGIVLSIARGSGGFGYDPFFEVARLGKTLAELSLAEKDAVSHRGAAFRGLIARLRSAAGVAGD